MKTVLAAILISFGVSFELKCQTTDTIVVGKNWFPPNVEKVDTLYVKGKLVKFEFDTLFFVNQPLIRGYFSTLRDYNELLILCKGTIDNIQVIHNQMKTILSDYFSETNKSLKSALDSLAFNNLRLDKWKAENSSLVSINNQLQIDLTKAQENIKSERWKSLGKKMLFGVGGIVLGVGISAIIYSVAK